MNSETAPLTPFFRPRSIAVIGASDNPASIGHAIFENLRQGGFQGEIIPVNPKWEFVCGNRAFTTLDEIPKTVDLAVICTPAVTVPQLIRQCGASGVRGAVVLSAGFRETGTSGTELEHSIARELAAHPQLRLIGPNCVGILVPGIGLNASFSQLQPKPGALALLSQSGALCTAMLGWAQDEGIGFSHFVSMGNMLDVGFDDMLDYLAEREDTSAIVLYMESVTRPNQFVAAARRCAQRKPIIVYKAGRSQESAKAAVSHTGAMAGDDAVYQAVFDETGLIRVHRLEDLFSTAELLARGRKPSGKRLAIVTNAGGPGVVAADALIDAGGELARLSPQSMGALDNVLPKHWSHNNPIDVIGDADSQRLAVATQIAMADGNVDAVLVTVTPQATIDLEQAAKAIAIIANKSEKPVLASWMGGSRSQRAIDVLQAARISTFPYPEEAIDAFMHVASYGETTISDPVIGDTRSLFPSQEARQAASAHMRERVGLLNESDSKDLFSLCGIPVSKTIVAHSSEEAIEAAQALGFPVALKLISPQVSHKSDVGGVRLSLMNSDAVADAFCRIQSALVINRPGATFAGVTVQQMVNPEEGLELIVGGRRDPTFGPVVLVGAGGRATQILADHAIALAPITIARARKLLATLRISPMLGEFRGRPALNCDATASVIVKMSQLLCEFPDILELESNPVLVTPTHAIALDARANLRGTAAV